MKSELDTKISLLETVKEMISCGLVEGTAGNVSARLRSEVGSGRAWWTPSIQPQSCRIQLQTEWIGRLTSRLILCQTLP